MTRRLRDPLAVWVLGLRCKSRRRSDPSVHTTLRGLDSTLRQDAVPPPELGPTLTALAAMSAGRTRIFTTKSATALLLALSLQGLGMFAIPGARAAELDGFDGKLDSDTSGDETYTWGIEYREPLTDYLNGGFVWLNEGHLPHNHRDGQAVQLWWHTQPDPLGLVFEAGLGPYRYYDTHLRATDPGFQDRHGWGALASASVDWYFASRWFVYLRLN